MALVEFKQKSKTYCRLIELALERHEQDLITLPKNKFRFNEEAYLDVVEFAETFLKFPDGSKAREPVKLHPIQIEHFIKPLFGWQMWDEELNKWVRRFNTAYIQLPKKNAKSFLLGVIGAYMMIADGYYGAKCFSAATGLKQARLVHNFAKEMLAISSKQGALRGKVDIVANTISFPMTMSNWTVMTGDADSNDGILPHFASVDEYHRWREDDLLHVIRKGMIGDEPMLVMITTAGSDMISPCYKERLYAEKVLEKQYTNERYFAYIAEPDSGDDWKNERTHEKVNPLLGVTIKRNKFEEEFQKALTSKSEELNFKRLHLNMWVSVDDYWLDMEKWRNQSFSILPEMLKGQTCFIGVDLSSTIDITAVVCVFPLDFLGEEYKQHFFILPYFFAPVMQIDRRTRSDGVPYREWYERGLLIGTNGDSIDQQAIRLKINELSKIYNVKEIAIDRWEATNIIQQLTEEDGFLVESMGQGFKSMNAPSKFLEVAVMQGKAIHNNNEILTWMSSNTAIATDPTGSIKPVKPDRAAREKIDGIVATLNALSRYMLHIDKPVGKYEKMGMINL
jgi:phage terminase large subunit-like protein